MFKRQDDKSVVEMVNSSNVISKETVIKGDIKAQGNIRVEGKVDGTLDSKNKIVIGESAFVNGNLYSIEAEISGIVHGEIHCKGILFLKKTAQIRGDIFTQKLVIENGASFNGACHMGDTIQATNQNLKIGAPKEKVLIEQR
ncbi:polymer-forming cytoskeletal protein [Belliella kenyensis]|uniref:Polymer-forming cytoskeletal protein n=1 Tax=Belliella kenyensis TaxID=1472724 RepID=A0ABV8EPF6_9BACT|nr:polymer-forming cytoskeletal protein [Belliella kenyensis]MCH7402545.1 polymer-forming cytoskeletal protein [Belliella kenyensis]MDN3603343.1 polymer-forming cytoskeletal protein [Belliella kenyensis]